MLNWSATSTDKDKTTATSSTDVDAAAKTTSTTALDTLVVGNIVAHLEKTIARLGEFQPTFTPDFLQVGFLCAVCSKIGAQMRCGPCESVMYCSTECQTIDWKRGHNEACKKMRDMSTGPASASASAFGVPTLGALPLDEFNSKGQPQCVLSGSALLHAISSAHTLVNQPTPAWTVDDVDLFVTERAAAKARDALEHACGMSFSHCVATRSKYEMNDANIHHVEVWVRATSSDAVKELSPDDKTRMGLAADGISHVQRQCKRRVGVPPVWRSEWRKRHPLTLQLIVVTGDDASAVVDSFDMDIVKNTLHRDPFHDAGYVIRVANVDAITECKATITPRESALLNAWCHSPRVPRNIADVRVVLRKHWPHLRRCAISDGDLVPCKSCTKTGHVSGEHRCVNCAKAVYCSAECMRTHAAEHDPCCDKSVEGDVWKHGTKAVARLIKYVERGFEVTNENSGAWVAHHYRTPNFPRDK